MRVPRALKSVLANLDGEAWLRFFIAAAGLALAFTAAILSTIARESGSRGATALLASTALLLAGAVGLTTVPYLAKRVAVARVREAFNYDVTREGMAYLGVALVIGIAALNTNNNLLFIVLAAMLAAVVVSGLASAAVLRGLELDVSMPQNAFAGRPILARIRLLNPRRRIPAFSVKVFTGLAKKNKRPGWELHKTEFLFPSKRPWVRLADYVWRRQAVPAAPPPRIFEKLVYFSFVPPGSAAEAPMELLFSLRGRYRQEGFQVATRFPFSFLTKSRQIRLARELLVYPALLESSDFLDVLPMITGELAASVRGRGVDLYRIREHLPDDPVRFVDWKASAKTATLKVREFTREDERRLRIVFDNPAAGTVSPPAYEHSVSMAASLAWHFAAENIELSFAAPGYQGGPHLDDFLRYLALVQPTERVPESALESLPLSSDYNVIVTARAPGSIPTSLWSSSYVIYMEPRPAEARNVTLQPL